MNRNMEKIYLMSSRIVLIIIANILVFAVLFGRLYFLQVYEAGKYKTMSDENRISTRFLLSPRGVIYDRNGEIIAKNEKHKYSVVATIPAQPFPVQEVQISITDKDKILCSITNTNGDTIPPVEAIVRDSDIMACNDEQYTFFVKQL